MTAGRMVAVTGGNGFIGAWVVRNIIDRGHTPVVLDVGDPGPLAHRLLGADLASVEWCRGDIRDAEQVSELVGRSDAVVHLAGVLTPFCRANPVQAGMINVMGTTNVLAAAARGLRGVSYASSAAVYSAEGLDLAPTSLYGAYKLSAELIATAFQQEFGLDSMGLRPLVVYGPGRESGASADITLACRAAAQHEPFEVAFGGETDVVFVADVADAFVISALDPLEGARSCSVSGALTTVDEVIETITDIAPGAMLTVGDGDLGIHAEIGGDDVRLMRDDVRRTSLRDGLAETIDAYRA